MVKFGHVQNGWVYLFVILYTSMERWVWFHFGKGDSNVTV